MIYSHMADLPYNDLKIVKSNLIQSGYVLGFSTPDFVNFIWEATNINIDEPKYSENNSGSKGQRLIKFIELEADYTVGKLLKALFPILIDYHIACGSPKEDSFYRIYINVFERLLGGQVVENMDAIQANNEDKDFHTLAKLIRESIEKNEPEAALDRLHTFLIKFLKELCDSHGAAYEKEDTVNALYGKYIKVVREKELIESDMADRIIKFSFQVMDAFNDIRNNKSFAHDNPVLNYDESVLIFSNITAMVKFIQSLEAKHKNKAVAEAEPDWGSF